MAAGIIGVSVAGFGAATGIQKAEFQALQSQCKILMAKISSSIAYPVGVGLIFAVICFGIFCATTAMKKDYNKTVAKNA